MPRAAMKLPAWLGSGMVLQAGMINTIEGKAEAAAQVSVCLDKNEEPSDFSSSFSSDNENYPGESFAEPENHSGGYVSHAFPNEDRVLQRQQTSKTRRIFDIELLTDSDTGEFSFNLPPIKPSFSTYSLTVIYDGYDYCFEDIYFGEVWLAAGESNMVMPVMYTDVKEDLQTLHNTKGLRFFLPNESGLKIGEKEYSFTPRSMIPGANWFESSDRAKASRVSAVAMSFAYNILKNIDCPVGIYDIACNDTCIHAWLPWRITQEIEPIHKHVKYLGHFRDQETYNRKDLEDPKYTEQLLKHERSKNAVYRHIPFSLRNQPAAIFNHKLYPLHGVGIRGIIWYQGESDALYPSYYETAFDYLAEVFEALFPTPDEKLSFIFSQLAPYYYSSENPRALAIFNEVLTAARHKISETRKIKAGMITVYDLSLEFSSKKERQIWQRPLNPIAKREIGRRMAEVALGLAYKSMLPAQRKTCNSAPECISAKQGKNTLTLDFDNTVDGIRKQASYGELSGFSVAGKEGIFVPCNTNSILGEQALLTVESIRKPVMCNYAFSSFNQEANCFNSRDIPLVPFRLIRDERHNYMPSMPWMYCNKTKIWALPPKSEIEGIEDSSKIFPEERDVWQSKAGKLSFALSQEEFRTTDASLEVSYKRMGEKPVVFGPVLSYASLYPPLDISMWREIRIVFKNKTRVSKKIGLCIVSDYGEKNLGSKSVKRPFTWETVSFLLSDVAEEYKLLKELNITLEDEEGEGVIYIDRITFAGLIVNKGGNNLENIDYGDELNFM